MAKNKAIEIRNDKIRKIYMRFRGQGYLAGDAVRRTAGYFPELKEDTVDDIIRRKEYTRNRGGLVKQN